MFSVSVLSENQEFVQEIDNYIKEKLQFSKFKDTYKDHVITATENISKILTEWTRQLRQEGAKRKLSGSVESFMDSSAATIMCNIFSATLGVTRQYSIENQLSRILNPSALCPGILPYAPRYVLYYSWSEDNPHLCGSKASFHRYDPAANGELLWSARKNSEMTDISILSCKDDSGKEEQIPAHSLILRLKSEYFRTALNSNSSFKKPEYLELGFSATAIKNMLEFLYKDEIAFEENNLNDFIELLQLAHFIKLDSLKAYIRTSLYQYVFADQRKLSQLDNEMTVNLINLANEYSMDEFIAPCLRIAEALEKEASESPDKNILTVDWKQVAPKKLVGLLITATELRLKATQKRLSACIKAIYNELQATKFEIASLKNPVCEGK